MPEFAEVNIQVAFMRERCLGWKIASFGYKGRRHFKNLSESKREAQLKGFFEGNVLEDVTQRGKQVILRTRHGAVTSHLMFKGRWTIEGDPFTSNYKSHKELPKEKGNSFWIVSEDGQKLIFNDPENMGHVSIFPNRSPGDIEALSKLGPEVLITDFTDPDFSDEWDLDFFASKASRSKKAIKAFLLEQKFQSGLGNMWVCESLYMAGIAPKRPAKELSPEEVERLHKAAIEIVQRAIDTQLDYDSIVKIYRKETDPDGNTVFKEKVAGRDTFWVPEKQS